MQDLLALRPYEDFFFIAEAGVNHEGSVEHAIEMVKQAASSGASAIKYQAYTAKGLAHRSLANPYWDEAEEKTPSQYELFSKYESFSKDEWLRVKRACEASDIEFWLSIFDLELFEDLAPLCDGIKVASGDITYKRLHDAVFRSGKRSIFSTGACSEDEIKKLDSTLDGRNALSLFCRLSYPTTDESAELDYYTHLSGKYSSMRGISDHCKEGKGESVLLAAMLGAVVVEKHFTLMPNAEGNDHYHSISPTVLKECLDMVERISILRRVTSTSIPTQSELAARDGARRSLFYSRDIKRGEFLGHCDLIELRPGRYISSSRVEEFLGKVLMHDVQAHRPLSESDFK